VTLFSSAATVRHLSVMVMDLDAVAADLAAESGLGHILAPYARGMRRRLPTATRKLRELLLQMVERDRGLTAKALLSPFDGREHPGLAGQVCKRHARVRAASKCVHPGPDRAHGSKGILVGESSARPSVERGGGDAPNAPYKKGARASRAAHLGGEIFSEANGGPGEPSW
jgi:hypothetical protein